MKISKKEITDLATKKIVLFSLPISMSKIQLQPTYYLLNVTPTSMAHVKAHKKVQCSNFPDLLLSPPHLKFHSPPGFFPPSTPSHILGTMLESHRCS